MCIRDSVVAAHRQAVLRAAVHRLRIDIIVLFGVLFEPALFAPCAEILDGLVVNLLRMFIRNGVEVDFGLDDVQQRTLGGFSLRLGGVQHVVGTRRHLGSVLFLSLIHILPIYCFSGDYPNLHCPFRAPARMCLYKQRF